MTKTLNQIIFFPPPKSEYFFRKTNPPPPPGGKLNGPSLTSSDLDHIEKKIKQIRQRRKQNSNRPCKYWPLWYN